MRVLRKARNSCISFMPLLCVPAEKFKSRAAKAIWDFKGASSCAL